MQNYAIVEAGFVTNIVVWDGEAPWSTTEGQVAVKIGDGAIAGIGYSVVDGKFEAPVAEDLSKVELIAEAECKKQQILQMINTTTQMWQTQFSLGIITDSDKSKLILWMTYAQLVDAVDTSTVPDISWPTSP